MVRKVELEPAGIQIQVDTELNPALITNWSRLHSHSSDQAVHLASRWYQDGLGIFHPSHSAYVISLKSNLGEPVGLVPLVIRKGHYRRLPVRILGFLDNPQTPYNELIIKRGSEPEVLQVLFEHLASFSDWDLVLLGKLQQDSHLVSALTQVVHQSNATVGTKDGNENPIIPLDVPWQTLLSNRSRKARKKLRNQINRLKKAGMTLTQTEIRDWSHPQIESMLRVSANSWKKNTGTDLNTRADDREFYRSICNTLGPQGLVSLWLMHLDNQPVAFEFQIIHNQVVYPLRSDFDESFSRYSPGIVLMAKVLETYCNQGGFCEYNTCGHNYPYLLDWTDRIKQLTQIELFKPSLRMKTLQKLEYDLIPVMRQVGLVNLAHRFQSRVRQLQHRYLNTNATREGSRSDHKGG